MGDWITAQRQIPRLPSQPYNPLAVSVVGFLLFIMLTVAVTASVLVAALVAGVG